MLKKNVRYIPFIVLTFAVLTMGICLMLAGQSLFCGKLGALTRDGFSLPDTTASFVTQSPGMPLPGENKCASLIHQSTWEPRPDNYAANHTVPTTQQIADLAPWGPDTGLNAKADIIRKQISGNFTGTTNEIFQWVACKWGFDDDIIRAEAVVESTWHQNKSGDWTTDRSLCPPGTWNGTGCFQSYGLLQIKYVYNKTAWPMSRNDAAFNVEYAYGLLRVCYEGWTNYLRERIPMAGYPVYHAGDLWGCIGMWYSGSWYDQAAISYINAVKTALQNKEWLEPEFNNGMFNCL